MLPRVLEPEVMDTPEEARDYDAMDHSAVNRVFVADFLAVWDGRGPILDLGTGTALIPIEFCRQSPRGEVVAVDAAEHMLTVARENVRGAGFESRITLKFIDAKRMPFTFPTQGRCSRRSLAWLPQGQRSSSATSCARRTRPR
jgi:ubiquinone/menaquinone biosynthesis C-methylase UbiE